MELTGYTCIEWSSFIHAIYECPRCPSSKDILLCKGISFSGTETWNILLVLLAMFLVELQISQTSIFDFNSDHWMVLRTYQILTPVQIQMNFSNGNLFVVFSCSRHDFLFILIFWPRVVIHKANSQPNFTQIIVW